MRFEHLLQCAPFLALPLEVFQCDGFGSRGRLAPWYFGKLFTASEVSTDIQRRVLIRLPLPLIGADLGVLRKASPWLRGRPAGRSSDTQVYGQEHCIRLRLSEDVREEKRNPRIGPRPAYIHCPSSRMTILRQNGPYIPFPAKPLPAKTPD